MFSSPSVGPENLSSWQPISIPRCQILLASARGQRPAQIARQLSCATQSVRNTIHAFHTWGLAALQAQSRRPKRIRLVLDAEPLRALLHERSCTWATTIIGTETKALSN